MALCSLQGHYALHWAALRGRSAAMLALLSAGANACSEAPDGRQPLHWACISGQARLSKPAVVRCHPAAVAPRVPTAVAHRTARKLRSSTCTRQSVGLSQVLAVELLLRSCASPDAADSRGYRAAHFAAQAGAAPVLFLLRREAHAGRLSCLDMSRGSRSHSVSERPFAAAAGIGLRARAAWP